MSANGAALLAGDIRALRARQSQQIFATELGIAMSSLANYEIGKRAPDARALLKFYAKAKQAGRKDLAKRFAAQANKVIGSEVLTP